MDTSGEVVDVSGVVVDVSGGEVVVDTSGEVVDVSGGVVTDTSGEVVDVSGGFPSFSGSIWDSNQVQVTQPTSICIDDILSSIEVLHQTETQHKSLLESISGISYDFLKPKLIEWAVGGFRNAHPVYEIYLSAPPLCSDGQPRSLQDYIQFISGKSIQDHVSALQARLQGITVSFAYTGSCILIVVSRPD